MRRQSAVLLATVAVLAADATLVRAAARVFVSVSGTDAGDCSDVNAPCRTLDFAVNAVDAGGAVIVLTTGSYAGATVGKSARIFARAAWSLSRRHRSPFSPAPPTRWSSTV